MQKTQISLVGFTETSLLVPDLSVTHHEAAITKLSERLQQAGRITDTARFVNAVLVHDALAMMVFDEVAFSLGRSDTVKETSFALGVTTQPIPWRTTPPAMARIIVLLAVPLHEETHHLALVPAFFNLLKRQTTAIALQKCTCPEEIFEIIHQASA